MKTHTHSESRTIVSVTETTISPYMLIVVVLAIAGAIFGLNKVSPWFMPIVFLASCVGMGLLIWNHQKESRRDRGEVVVEDYERLAATDLTRYAPWLKQNIRGQDETVDALVDELQRNLSLARAGRTLGAYMLVGPTGTGKTFLAQLIAQALYPDSDPVILRMNQYKHADDVYTLLGPPPGSSGFEVGGSLTRPVLENPFRVIVLDELDKAHRDLQHCLYDILDTASCREKSSGRLVDFSKSVFFGTCNGGVEAMRTIRTQTVDPAFWLGRARDALVEAAGFDRAFLARWTDIFLMDELAPLHVAEVACLQLQRHWQQYGIEVRYVAPELIMAAVEGNEEFKSYGVRQLGAYIQMKTNDGIANARKSGATQVNLSVNERGALTVVRANSNISPA
jgi:ATP-dependent Clp protease ATP-binding subunit ClpA